jgi:hypothetical protein
MSGAIMQFPRSANSDANVNASSTEERKRLTGSILIHHGPFQQPLKGTADTSTTSRKTYWQDSYIKYMLLIVGIRLLLSDSTPCTAYESLGAQDMEFTGSYTFR